MEEYGKNCLIFILINSSYLEELEKFELSRRKLKKLANVL